MKKFLILGLFLVSLSACKVELSENETADLSIAWTCVYRVGQGLSCPGKAITKIQGKTTSIINKTLGITEDDLAGTLVSNSVSRIASKLNPHATAITCAEIAGDGICFLVKVANSDKVTVTSSTKNLNKNLSFRKHSKKAKVDNTRLKLKSGTYTITAKTTVLNQANHRASPSPSASPSSSPTRTKSSLLN